MADSFITKCPHCQVKFKLTESQINAAAGSVRCGACLNVFNAKNHLIEQIAKKVAPATSAPAKKAPEKKPELETQSSDDTSFSFDLDSGDIEDDLSESLFSDLDAQSSEYDLSDESIQDGEDDISESLFSDLDAASSDTPSDSFSADKDDINSLFEDSKDSSTQDRESQKTPEQPQPSKVTPVEQAKSDDSDLYDINNLFDSESESSIATKTEEDDSDEDDFIFGVDETNEFEIDDNFLNFEENTTDAFTDDAIIATDELTEKVDNDEDNHDDESWTKALVEDEKPVENKAVFSSKNLGESQQEPKQNPKKSKSFYGDQLPNDFDNEVTQIDNSKHNAKKLVHQIEQDTHDLDNLLEKGSRGILNFFAWSFLSLILLASLAGQYIYYNFDFIAQSKWRPQLTLLCEKINCTIPATQIKTTTISIEKFQVTEHPTLSDAVKILFVLRNSKIENIDYPNVVIQIFDKNEKLIGDQAFKPSQYLPSQIKTKTSMPAKTDVQATIIIKDLGVTARNYKVAL